MSLELRSLLDEELQYLVKRDLGFFLEPIKTNQKSYMRYNSLLGNMQRKSILVRNNLPKIAVAQYRKQDSNFVKCMEEYADRNKQLFLDMINDTLQNNLMEAEVRELSNEDLADVFLNFQDSTGRKLDYELLWIQMKLMGIANVEERKKEIISLCGGDSSYDEKHNQEVNDSEDIENDDGDEEVIVIKKTNEEKTSQESKKSKVKKLTPEEKAAKNRAAILAKEKAKQEEQRKKENLDLDQQEQNEEQKLDIDQSYNEVKVDVAELPENTVVDTEKKVIEQKRILDNTEGESIMNKYIGIVNIKTNYYNFTPIGYVENGTFTAYSERDLDYLLPLSNKHNINFYYNFYNEDHNNFMLQHFDDGQPVMLNCEIDNLEENRMSDGTINATGYKLPAIDGFQKGQISYLSKEGLYQAVSKDSLLDDIETKKAIRIKIDNIKEGERVLVNLGEGFYAGPFTVKYSPTNRTFYLNMQAEEGKHYIEGYDRSDCLKITVETSADVESWIGYSYWDYYAIKSDAKIIRKDFISDKELLESFKNTLENTNDLDYSNLDVNGIIEKIGVSQIVDKSIPEEIANQRIERIRAILSSEEKLKNVYANASDLICELLIKYKDNMQTQLLFEELITKRPDLLDKMQGLRSVQQKVENARADLEKLEAQRSNIEAIIKEKQDAALTESIKNDAIEEQLTDELIAKKTKLDELLNQIGIAETAFELQERIEKLKEEARYYENHKLHLVNDAKNLESKFVELINGYSEKIADITFDGFMSSKMLEAAAGWEEKEEMAALSQMVDKINLVQVASLSDTELIDYLVRTIQIPRPGYGKNTIINILTCVTQGFLTVFSGLPGCGKTSICNIISKVLGLSNYESLSKDFNDVNRYIPVSVERGWTSKRDFIGYYNPLTKTFEESNRAVFDGLRFLNMEKKKGYSKWPFFILLDEANLSPMEYYWADFMNVCDDLMDNTVINLGNNNIFNIPQTLHFLATINNDHTTETLSPRLIDRAWVISLPKSATIQYGQELRNEQIRNINWEDIERVFVGRDKKAFDRETQSTYEGLKDKLNKMDIYVSPRVDIAIHNYWSVASGLMEEDEYGNDASTIALDYAIAQKVLPKIMGSGDEYEALLEELKAYCNNKSLSYTADIIASIISRGNRQMKYYQFFN